MKFKKSVFVVAAIVVASFMFQSCIGSFSLTNKVLTWNRNVSNKFVNELVFFAFWVLPVYEVTAAADLLVINSIEFWSGNTPLEANNKAISTDEGNYYIHAKQDGYKIESPNGDVLNFKFDEKSQTWSFYKNNDQPVDFLKFYDENHVSILGNDGDFVDVELSNEGVGQYMSAIGNPLMALI